MSEVLQTNVFFFITSVAVVIVTILVVVILYYAVKTMRNVSKISDTVQHKTDELAGDIDNVRQEIRVQGSSLKGIFNMIIRQFKPKKHHAKKSE